jgi:two-component system sensor histidine kinase TctE
MGQGSLRRGLLKRLSLSFGISLLLLIPLIYQLIQRPASQAYDHEVSDATLSLIPYLQEENGKVVFNFPKEAEQVLRTDSRDEIHFLVMGPNGHFIAGDADLAAQGVPHPTLDDTRMIMYDGAYHGRDVRISATQRAIGGQGYLFLTAETTNKRDALASNSGIATLLSLLVLVAVSVINVWYSIRHALVPLDDLRTALHNMQQSDLLPLDESRVPSEIKPLVQEFNGLLQRLDSSLEVQQRFVANAAHQLRTPLAGIRTQLELLRDEIADDRHRLRITHSIDAIAGLGHLVHQMLALLSSVPGAREVSVQSFVNVADIIRERMTEWVRSAAQRQVDLGFEIDRVIIYGDPLLVGEMIANLVDNAVRYSPLGAVVTVRCRHSETDAIIEVEDNGPGIPWRERELVFERFYRLSVSAPISGSGLGLAIVREVAHGLGGVASIDVPASGAGCVVRVVCPLADNDARCDQQLALL